MSEGRISKAQPLVGGEEVDPETAAQWLWPSHLSLKPEPDLQLNLFWVWTKIVLLNKDESLRIKKRHKSLNYIFSNEPLLSVPALKCNSLLLFGATKPQQQRSRYTHEHMLSTGQLGLGPGHAAAPAFKEEPLIRLFTIQIGDLLFHSNTRWVGMLTCG